MRADGWELQRMETPRCEALRTTMTFITRFRARRRDDAWTGEPNDAGVGCHLVDPCNARVEGGSAGRSALRPCWALDGLARFSCYCNAAWWPARARVAPAFRPISENPGQRLFRPPWGATYDSAAAGQAPQPLSQSGGRRPPTPGSRHAIAMATRVVVRPTVLGNRGRSSTMHRAEIDQEHNRLILRWIDSLNLHGD